MVITPREPVLGKFEQDVLVDSVRIGWRDLTQDVRQFLCRDSTPLCTTSKVKRGFPNAYVFKSIEFDDNIFELTMHTHGHSCLARLRRGVSNLDLSPEDTEKRM